jgi:hypothetical protein
VIQPARALLKIGQPALFRLVLAFACGPLAACASGSPAVASNERPTEELPPYTAEAAELFDDSLAPEVFGFKVDRSNILEDSVFKDRVQASDQVQAVRLSTIQQDRIGQTVHYRLVLSPVGPPLVGDPLPPDSELRVGLGSPSLNLIRSMDIELVGKEFIVLLKVFRLSGKAVIHFRAEPNTAPMREAITKLRSATAS